MCSSSKKKGNSRWRRRAEKVLRKIELGGMIVKVQVKNKVLSRYRYEVPRLGPYMIDRATVITNLIND